MKINIRYLKLSKQFLCIQHLSVYIYRQEEREDDFESKTEISLSCQLKAGKNYIQYLYTVYITIYTVYIHTEVSIYRIYDIVTIYTVYIHTRLSLFQPDLSRLCQRCSRPNSRILDFQNLESGPNFDQVALDSAATCLSFFTATLFILRGFFLFG